MNLDLIVLRADAGDRHYAHAFQPFEFTDIYVPWDEIVTYVAYRIYYALNVPWSEITWTVEHKSV